MSRSERYPTRYRVGILDGKDIYLHPQLGLSIEQDHRLRGMTPKELEAWFRQEQDAMNLAKYACPIFLAGKCTDPAQCVHPETGQLTCWHWNKQREVRQDIEMLAEIEARREEELEEIGHDRAYGRPHLPMIIRRENA